MLYAAQNAFFKKMNMSKNEDKDYILYEGELKKNLLSDDFESELLSEIEYNLFRG